MVQPYRPNDVLGLVGVTHDGVRFDACVDEGGFGLIYKGFHLGLGEPVAIKALRIASIQKTNEAIREALAGRFRDETKLLYRLSQGNLDIVRCISSGTIIAPRTNEYTPYMVLEWLDGYTLSAELKERRDRRLGARTLKAAVQLLDSAASGIAFAHTHDVVHRDVKPGNLFLTRTREGLRMKVLDFGLAKILSDEAIGVRSSVETGIGVHFCSPSYGAPEQFTHSAGAIGPWTDVYSFCLVLLEVMTGEKVRPAGNLAQGLLAALDPQRGSPTASSLGLKVPKPVEALLERAVAQDPKLRPHDVGVFWLELKDAMSRNPHGDAAATFADIGPPSSLQTARDAALAKAALAAAQPSPFAGTMVMGNPPSILQVSPEPAPVPRPAAGRPPEAETRTSTPPTGQHNKSDGSSTAPMAPPLTQRQSNDERMKGTLPMGAFKSEVPPPMGPLSPLASSVAISSPLAAQNLMGGYAQPSTTPSAYPPSQLSAPPPHFPSQVPQMQERRIAARTDPRMDLTKPGVTNAARDRRRLIMSVLAMFIAALGVIGGVGYWFLRLRHR